MSNIVKWNLSSVSIVCFTEEIDVNLCFLVSYDVNEMVYSEPKYFHCVSLAPGATLPIQYILLNDTIKTCTVHNLTYERGEIGGHGVASKT